MIGDGVCGEIGGMKIDRGNRGTRRKPAPAPLGVMCVVCVLCLIVVPLPPVETPFAVKTNNNNKIPHD
jgi:hypothetical protein